MLPAAGDKPWLTLLHRSRRALAQPA